MAVLYPASSKRGWLFKRRVEGRKRYTTSGRWRYCLLSGTTLTWFRSGGVDPGDQFDVAAGAVKWRESVCGAVLEVGIDI